jgi:large subunit ribosomal protein L17
MRHSMANRKLGRTSSHRKALFRNQLASLIEHERIVTTLIKAKELRPIAEKIVTLGKKGSLHARRNAAKLIASDALLRKLFDDIAPRFNERAGGYTRIVKLGARRGDAAEMAILEFVDFTLGSTATAAPEPTKKSKSKPAADAPESDAPADAEEKPAKKASAKKAEPKKAPAKKAAAKKAEDKKAPAKKAPAKKADAKSKKEK